MIWSCKCSYFLVYRSKYYSLQFINDIGPLLPTRRRHLYNLNNPLKFAQRPDDLACGGYPGWEGRGLNLIRRN